MLNKKGFTMLEIMLVIAILGVLLTFATQLISFSSAFTYQQMEDQSTRRVAQENITYLVREIQNADEIYVYEDQIIIKTDLKDDIRYRVGEIDGRYGLLYSSGSYDNGAFYGEIKILPLDQEQDNKFSITDGKRGVQLDLYVVAEKLEKGHRFDVYNRSGEIHDER